MNFKDTELFPYPHVVKNEMRDGCLISWPESCRSCAKRSCFNPANDIICTCSGGYDYQRIDKNIIIGGVLVKESPTITPAKRKRMQQDKLRIISKSSLASAVSAFKLFKNAFSEEIARQKIDIIKDYVKSNQYKVDFLSELKDEIQKGLSFVHDYKQINMQISQNINVIIESKYSGCDISEKIEKSTDNEKAIYYASKMLDEKLNVAKFLMHPEWLYKREDCVPFRVHGLITKYYKIYKPLFNKKNIKHKIVGESYLESTANPQAVAVIPQTLIDNAAKYTLKNGSVEICINDCTDHVEISVTNYGPKIEKREIKKIFEPFYRGEAAKAVEDEGAGYGLYVSQMIATQHLGSEIIVEQESREIMPKHYKTTFSVKIPTRAKILF